MTVRFAMKKIATVTEAMNDRSHFKTSSEARWLRCRFSQNAHILPSCMLRFFVNLRLALKSDPRF